MRCIPGYAPPNVFNFKEMRSQLSLVYRGTCLRDRIRIFSHHDGTCLFICRARNPEVTYSMLVSLEIFFV